MGMSGFRWGWGVGIGGWRKTGAPFPKEGRATPWLVRGCPRHRTERDQGERGAAVQIDAVAIEIGAPEMDVAGGSAVCGDGAQAFDALAVNQVTEVHSGAPSCKRERA